MRRRDNMKIIETIKEKASTIAKFFEKHILRKKES